MEAFDATVVAQEFGLGQPQTCNEIGEDGRGIMSMTTTAEAYVIKPTQNPDWLTLYSAVEQTLNTAGVRQARLYCRPSGDLLSDSGHAVYELLPGEPTDQLNPTQLRSTMHYLTKYNEALASIAVPRWLLALDDPWQRAASPEFLVEELPAKLDALDLPPQAQRSASDCLDFLATHRTSIERPKKQLIHGDIGPDNILFDGDEIVAVIDFTPQLGSELYSLCQFFYWHSVFPWDSDINLDQISDSLGIYEQESSSISVDEETLKATMVLAAAFRLFGPTMAMEEKLVAYPEAAIVKRADLLAQVLSASFAPAIPS